VLVENCFDNASFPRTDSGVDDGEADTVTEAHCPMNMFRSGGDMRADWPLMLRRLQTIVPWLGLSRPGCWAYLDMLEVRRSLRRKLSCMWLAALTGIYLCDACACHQTEARRPGRLC
jgi:hypothetical protein